MKVMQHKITSRKNFETKIFYNPKLFLKAIKETRFNLLIIADALRVFLNTKQKLKESLQDLKKDLRQIKT